MLPDPVPGIWISCRHLEVHQQPFTCGYLTIGALTPYTPASQLTRHPTMAPRIYTSPVPSFPVVNTSIFTHLFSSSDDPNNIGGYPGSAPAFVDAPSSTSITRAQLKRLALSLGYGLRNHPNTSLKRGDTVLVYSHNSLHWPVVLFGSGIVFFFRD